MSAHEVQSCNLSKREGPNLGSEGGGVGLRERLKGSCAPNDVLSVFFFIIFSKFMDVEELTLSKQET